MKQPGKPAESIVETIDLYPTLCELVGLDVPESLDGASLKPQLLNSSAPSDAQARSFWRNSQSVRTDGQRLTRQSGKGGERYNLFLFPENEPPSEDELKQAIGDLSARFFK